MGCGGGTEHGVNFISHFYFKSTSSPKGRERGSSKYTSYPVHEHYAPADEVVSQGAEAGDSDTAMHTLRLPTPEHTGDSGSHAGWSGSSSQAGRRQDDAWVRPRAGGTWLHTEMFIAECVFKGRYKHIYCLLCQMRKPKRQTGQ